MLIFMFYVCNDLTKYPKQPCEIDVQVFLSIATLTQGVLIQRITSRQWQNTDFGIKCLMSQCHM